MYNNSFDIPIIAKVKTKSACGIMMQRDANRETILMIMILCFISPNPICSSQRWRYRIIWHGSNKILYSISKKIASHLISFASHCMSRKPGFLNINYWIYSSEIFVFTRYTIRSYYRILRAKIHQCRILTRGRKILSMFIYRFCSLWHVSEQSLSFLQSTSPF